MTERGGWHIVVPVRRFSTGKARLRRFPGDPIGDEIARRLALRTLGLLASVPEVSSVILVSDEPQLSVMQSSKVHVIQEAHPRGLNAAVDAGLFYVLHRWTYGAAAGSGLGPAFEPGGRRVLVMHADLPFLTRSEFRTTLSLFERLGRDAFIPDESGGGTTALAFFGDSNRRPCFGAGSAQRHAAAGFKQMSLRSDHGFRVDLDTPQQLAQYFASESRFPVIQSLLSGVDYRALLVHVHENHAAA